MDGDTLRKRLRLSQQPTQAEGDKDAAVLILLDATDVDVRVFLCVRSRSLRKHPGEVCFPGGMLDDDDVDLRFTAIREAEEEVGVTPDDYEILGNLPMFRARFGIAIHPTVALLKRQWPIRLSEGEVESTFWVPLDRFLDDDVHSSLAYDNHYLVHMFDFPERTTYGVTALLCIVVAICVLQRRPDFQLFADIDKNDVRGLSIDQVIAKIYSWSSKKFMSNL